MTQSTTEKLLKQPSEENAVLSPPSFPQKGKPQIIVPHIVFVLIEYKKIHILQWHKKIHRGQIITKPEHRWKSIHDLFRKKGKTRVVGLRMFALKTSSFT